MVRVPLVGVQMEWVALPPSLGKIEVIISLQQVEAQYSAPFLVLGSVID